MTLMPTQPEIPNASDRQFAVAERECAVISNDAVNAEYRMLVLSAPPVFTAAQPGQFFHLLCPRGGGEAPFFRRPMSVYRVDPDKGEVAFLYKVTGAGTESMAALRPGDGFNILGPLGIGFDLPDGIRHVLLLARGVGLATLAPLAQVVAARPDVRATAIFSARKPEFLMSVDYMAAHGVDVVGVTDSEGTSAVDRVESLMRDLLAGGNGVPPVDAIYTCGSNRLMRLAQKLAAERGIFGQVAMEQQMACGLGMCFCCVRDFNVGGDIVHRRVCCEGPVFDLQEAVSW
ncbi:dihydroorotate dehydrogenase electron transfer subunit [Fodinicurvata sp. EGI_FJ10296]|uniref:dihydroorotate dehydrogenase electron transfer subunit n=1 Tax=Fodinicurvata sp. EGI_FJ10296 TaxID=3231908 RepID=UPI0034566E14